MYSISTCTCGCRNLLKLSTSISAAVPPSLISLLFSSSPSFLHPSLSTCLPVCHPTSLPPFFPLSPSFSFPAFLSSLSLPPSLPSSLLPPPLSPSHFLNRSPGGNRHSVHLPVTPPPHSIHPPLASSLSYAPSSPNQQHPPLHPSLSAVPTPSSRSGTSLIRVFLPADQRTTVRFSLTQPQYTEAKYHVRTPRAHKNGRLEEEHVTT